MKQQAKRRKNAGARARTQTVTRLRRSKTTGAIALLLFGAPALSVELERTPSPYFKSESACSLAPDEVSVHRADHEDVFLFENDAVPNEEDIRTSASWNNALALDERLAPGPLFEAPQILCGHWTSDGETTPLLLVPLEAVRSEGGQTELQPYRLYDGMGKHERPVGSETTRDFSWLIAPKIDSICRDPDSGLDQILLRHQDTGTGSTPYYRVLITDSTGRWSEVTLGELHWESDDTLMQCAENQTAYIADAPSRPCACRWRPVRAANNSVESLIATTKRYAGSRFLTYAGEPDSEGPALYLLTDVEARKAVAERWQEMWGLAEAYVEALKSVGEFGPTGTPFNFTRALTGGPYRVQVTHHQRGWQSADLIYIEDQARAITALVVSPLSSSRTGDTHFARGTGWTLNAAGRLSFELPGHSEGKRVSPGSIDLSAAAEDWQIQIDSGDTE